MLYYFYVRAVVRIDIGDWIIQIDIESTCIQCIRPITTDKLMSGIVYQNNIIIYYIKMLWVVIK